MNAGPGTTDPPPSDPPRITMARSQRSVLSGKWMVAILFLSLGIASTLVPIAAHLPRWVEFEMVIGIWWVIWAIALTAILYSAVGVADDMAVPSKLGGRLSAVGEAGGCLPDAGCIGADLTGSCGEAIGGFVIIVLLLAAAWLLIELVIPALAFLIYFAIRGMLARAVNDRQECCGKPLRSLGWGIVWATAYTAPVALVVLFVHKVYVHMHPGMH